MTALDIFVLLLLGGGALVGFVRGFVHEALALLAWIAAIVALKLFHGDVQGMVGGATSSATGAAALAFALLFLPVYLGVRLLARVMGRGARKSVLGPVDRFLGGGFGMLKGLVGATLFFLLANLATDMVYGAEAERPEWMTQSRTFPLLNASGRAIVDWVEEQRGRERQESR
ncbi:CvpA family protein [Sphingomonas sp. GCM10030256]|uniref:CvpA family protein n=1 Tax=Sphingomonas sp. GCM10030256 TaxID=3273427 RepID=UPI003624585B